MTEHRIFEIINEVYGYEIISEKTLEKLRSSSDIIVSEFGIESIYEFLSYDITEFTESRKSIHVRRFYQSFKDIFDINGFTIEAFHKIQAGCLYAALTSGIVRGYGSYDYSGFVSEVLQRVRSRGGGDSGMTPSDILEEIAEQFKLFSRISLGIYSLQIFTKYGMCLEKLKLGKLESSSKLFIDALKKIEKGKDAADDIKKILDLRVPTENKINEVVDEYIDYAVNGVMEEGIPLSRTKAAKELMNSVEEVRIHARKAFTALSMDIEGIRRYKKNLKEKLNLLVQNKGNNDFSILYVSMLEKLILDLGKLSYYEDIYFIKRLNAMFVNKVEDVFNAQMAEERNIIQEQCIRIIEQNLEGYSVFELDGVLNALSMHKEDFAFRYSYEEEEIEEVLDELKKYLRLQLEMVYDIRRNMKENLSEILSPDILREESSDILVNAISNFTDIRGFLLEDE